MQLVQNLSESNRNLNRNSILEYEEFAKAQPQVDIPVKHYIHGGMYAREITIPKDTFLTGQIYKFDHFDVMVSGDITVSTDDGESKRLKGYHCFKGMSGKKRAGYAHEDTTWITFHPFTGSDGDEIQRLITSESFEDLNAFYAQYAQIHYHANFGGISGLIEEQSKAVSDLCDYELDTLKVAPSNINGVGVFAQKRFKAGDFICKMRVKDKRTTYGKHANHSPINNAELNDNLDLVANRNIEKGDEITVNYFQVLQVRNEVGDLCQE